MADITLTPVARLRVGRVFNRSFALLSGDFAKFVALTAIAWSPNLVLQLLDTSLVQGHATLRNAAVALQGILSILAQAAVLYGAIQRMRGSAFSIGESLRQVSARFGALFRLGICTSVGLIVGLVLLVIPGVVLYLMWYVAVPATIIEQLGAVASMKRSASLTKGNRWPLFAIAVVIMVVTVIADVAIARALLALAGKTVSVLGEFAWTSLQQAFSAIVIAVVYHDLRVIREGADIEEIAAVFD